MLQENVHDVQANVDAVQENVHDVQANVGMMLVMEGSRPHANPNRTGHFHGIRLSNTRLT